MKTGEVKEMHSQTLFSQHHVNAYETEDGKEILLDLSPSDPFGLRYLKSLQFTFFLIVSFNTEPFVFQYF